MAISLKKFIDTTYLTEVDASELVGVKGECVTLIQQYLKQCFDMKIYARGDAKYFGNTLIKEGVAKEVSKPQYGDIIVWGEPYGLINGQYYGHVAIYINDNLIYDQNNGWITPVRAAQHRPMLAAKPLQYIRMNKALVTDTNTKPTPTYDKELDKYTIGDYVECSVLRKSHHEDPIAKYGTKENPIKGYVIHKYPEDKYPLALSDKPGGKQIGATSLVNVWVRKDGSNKPTEKPKPIKEYIQLDKSRTSWSVYPLGKALVSSNAIGQLNPSLFGGLEYEILDRPVSSAVTIQTRDWGKVNIYVGSDVSQWFKIVKK